MTPETRVRIEALSENRRTLLQDLRAAPSGLAWCERHTAIADEIVRLIFADATEGLSGRAPIAVIATGGYGRRELAPYSDIDITIVPFDQASGALDDAIRQVFQDLHWAFCTLMRMDVGYAYRLVSDAPGLDVKTRTGLLDMRLVAGSPDLFRILDEALYQTFSAGEFVLAKIAEREEMYAKHHDTPLVVEPHLKEGAGGLRDHHCANWLREAIGERPSRPSAAYDTLIRVRNLLHLQAGRHQDLFSRTRQLEIAEELGIDGVVMMAEVIESASVLHAVFSRAREKLREARFSIAPGALAVQGEVRILGNANAGDAAVGVAVATRLGLSVSDLPIQVLDEVSGPAALYALSTGEATLRNLDRCSLLEALLPELVLCRTLVPADSVHTYTVYEHSLRVVRHLDSLEPGTFLGDLKASRSDLEPLFLAALLHDVGKIDPHRKHEVVGAEIAQTVVQRWHLSQDLADTIVWLVAMHLEMARFIRVRDLQRPDTIEEFAGLVGDADRLALLTLLTWADVSAVNEAAWTPAQDTFLRQLYERTLLRLQGEVLAFSDMTVTRQRLLRQIKGKAEDENVVRAFLDSLPAYYLTSTPPDVVRLHLELATRAARGEPTVEQFHRPDLSATDLTVCSLDSPALLSRLLGVFYAYDLSLLGIRASTTDTDPPVAIDVFTLAFGGRPVPPATVTQVSRGVYDVISGARTVEEILSSRGKDPKRRQKIFRYSYISGNPGIVEVSAPRGRGMPYRFSRLLSEQGWNIIAARVGQWAGNASAAFYVQGPGGRLLTPQEIDVALAQDRVPRLA